MIQFNTGYVRFSPFRRAIVLWVVAVLMGVGALGVPVQQAESYLPNAYGGRTFYMYSCTCMPGCYLMFIGLPTPGMYLYCPAMDLRMMYNVYPVAWQLGRTDVMVPCLMIAYPYCYPIAFAPMWTLGGTSLF